MSRLFSVVVTEHVDGELAEGDAEGALVSAECVADILRCIADDIVVYEFDAGKLVNPDG